MKPSRCSICIRSSIGQFEVNNKFESKICKFCVTSGSSFFQFSIKTDTVSMSSSIVERRPLLELLLLSAASSDPYSTLAIDPHTGVSQWSYKGSELQGAVAASVHLIGTDRLLIGIADRPIVHTIGIHVRDRFHQRSVLPGGTVHDYAIHPDGTVMCAAIDDKIYTWMMTTGQLLTIIEAHYQPIARLAITADGSLLISAGCDGVVQVWELVSLMTPHDSGLSRPEPVHKWTSHSLPINDLYVSKAAGANCRILTCGNDRVSALNLMSTGECQLTMISDRIVVACTMDVAESRIFLGTIDGDIALINLYQQPIVRERHLSMKGDANLPTFKQHRESITRLSVNLDGSLLVSGDRIGQYCIWDICSRQCLKSATLKGSITTAMFIPNWSSFCEQKQHVPASIPISVFQKQLAKSIDSHVPIIVSNRCESNMALSKSIIDEQLIDDRLMRYQLELTSSDRSNKSRRNDRHQLDIDSDEAAAILDDEGIDEQERPMETIESLKAELQKMKATNQKLYQFALNHLVDDD